MKFTKEFYDKHFSYDAITGVLIWRDVLPRSKAKVGDVAGFIDREGYSTIPMCGTTHKAHRVIWIMVTGEAPNQIDHINGDRADNRLENLRSVTNKENSRNQRLRCTNSSGHSGVCWHKRFNKWISQIKVDGKYKYLGMFEDKESAVTARKAAEIEYGFHENHGKDRARYQHS